MARKLTERERFERWAAKVLQTTTARRESGCESRRNERWNW